MSLDRLLCQVLLGAAFPMDQGRLNRCSTGDTWGMLKLWLFKDGSSAPYGSTRDFAGIQTRMK
jgi:hypothetical protein